MIQLDPLCRHRGAGSPLPRPAQHLVHRVHPAVAPAGMGLLAPKHHAFTAVRGEGPSVAVGRLPRARPPSRLQRPAPARMEHLVQVGADADVRILGHQLQRAVPGIVEPPGRDDLPLHPGSPGPQALHRAVGGAGVQHHHLISLSHGIHPAVGKLLLILTDGVNDYLHGQFPLACPRLRCFSGDGGCVCLTVRSPGSRR